MRFWQALLAGVVVGVVAAAFRDFENDRWLTPAGFGGAGGAAGGAAGGVGEEDPEPVLGYDGMDVETLLDWLDGADLSRGVLEQMRSYEQRHLGREAVLDAVDDLLEG